MRYLIPFLFLLIPSLSYSNEVFYLEPFEEWSYSVAYNFFTFHHGVDTYEDDRTEIEYPINDNNDFVGLRVNVNENLGIFFAKGKSSVNEPSKMLGIEISQDDKTWELGSDFGMATGYEPIISSGKIPFINPFLRYNYQLTKNTKLSVKGGVMNFLAENFFAEYTFKF